MKFFWSTSILVLLTGVLSGCRSDTASPQTPPPPTAGYQQPGVPVDQTSNKLLIPTGPDNRGVNVEKSIGKSECADQLSDIDGALIMYYRLHKAMPAKLEDLKSLADVDAPLKFTCPISGKQYLYSASGLAAPGKADTIVVYDATPVHQGFRWCIIVHPSPPGQINTEIVPIKESDFRQYVAVSP